MPRSLHSAAVALIVLLPATGADGLAQTGAYEEVGHFTAGVVRGRVVLSGDAPPAETLHIERDAAVCGTSTPSPGLVLGPEGGVGNAVVYLAGVARGKPRGTEPAVLEQRGCVFFPHVSVVPAGAGLEILNHDPILHTVHAKDPARHPATVFHIAQALVGQRTFVAPSVLAPPPGGTRALRLSCEVGHTWMSAWLFLVDHPYAAVTAPDGTFVLPDVPAGKHRIAVWHERATSFPAEPSPIVRVKPDEAIEIELPITLNP